MIIVPFLDRRIIRPATTDCWIDERAVSGGMTATGAEQVVGIATGLWRYVLSNFEVVRADQVREVRRFVTAMHGRVNATLVPFFEKARAPYPVDQYGRALTPALVRTRELDGTPYADPADLADNLIDAITISDNQGNPIIPVGATGMQIQTRKITRTINGTSVDFLPTLPVAGNIFSVGQQAFIIESVQTVGNASNIVCTTSPPVRTAIPQSTACNFTTPSALMRFATDDQGRMALQQWRMASVSMEFVEVL